MASNPLALSRLPGDWIEPSSVVMRDPTVIAPLRVNQILSTARSETGNFTIGGEASRARAMAAGVRWVGRGARFMRDRRTGRITGLISKDGTRSFRLPSNKGGGRVQANFERWHKVGGRRRRLSNAHLDIKS
jgi:hypothetical protein